MGKRWNQRLGRAALIFSLIAALLTLLSQGESCTPEVREHCFKNTHGNRICVELLTE